MHANEMEACKNAIIYNPFDAINTLFCYGYAKGYRAAVAEMKKGGGMKDTSSKPIEWKSAEYHRKEILKIMEKIENSWILWQVHRFVINITKEDD